MANQNEYIKTDLGFWKDEENNAEMYYQNEKQLQNIIKAKNHKISGSVMTQG